MERWIWFWICFFLLGVILLTNSGCTTINVSTVGDVAIDAHKVIEVVDPSAVVGIPFQ